MNELVNEKISVISSYERMTGLVMPKKLFWHERIYTIIKLGYYHKIKEGRYINHIFHVTDGNLDFRLCLNSENLHWTLEEVCDGTAA